MPEAPLSKPNRRLLPRWLAPSLARWVIALLLLLACPLLALADPTANPVGNPAFSPPLHNAGLSLLRLLGAFAIVIAVLFLGVWALKNWQRIALRNGARARLNVLEAKSLGNRQFLFVVGYEQQRMLVGASSGGITLLALLPESTGDEPALPAPTPTFSGALAGLLARKPSP